MAGIEAALLPPPPQARWTSAAATLRRLLALAADVVVYGFVATMWLNNAAFAAAIFLRWASGEDSTAVAVAIFSRWSSGEDSTTVAVAVAMKVFRASLLAMGVFVPFAGPLLMWRLGPPPPPETRESGSGGRAAAQRGRRDSTGPASRRQEGGRRPVGLLFMVFSWWVVFAGILLQELATVKGSCQEKVGSVLTDIGSFANSVMLCFIFFSRLGDLPDEGFAEVKCGITRVPFHD